MTMKRRQFVTAVASLTGATIIAERGHAKEESGCSCVETRSVSEQTDPDFTVRTDEIDVPIYWKEDDEFVDVGYGGAIGLAFGADDKVWLNEQYTGRINQSVIAHEIGHLFGYEHVEGTIMGSSFFKMDDYDGEVELTDVTRDVISKIDGMEVWSWEDDVAFDHLDRVAIDYALDEHDGLTSITIASNRYSGYLDQYDSVYFSTHWNNYNEMVDGYYRFYSDMF